MDSITHVNSMELGRFSHITEVDFSVLPNRFVIKPQDGASNNGVFVLERKSDETYYDSMRRMTYTPEQIVETYLDEFQRFKSIHLPVYIEERFDSANPDYPRTT